MEEKLRFGVNPQKTIEVILWVAHRDKGNVDIYKVLKTLFFADVFHLNTYGRPITGDNYVAMIAGPVASFCYDVLKQNDIAKAFIKDFSFARNDIFVVPGREPNLDLLSETDIEALEKGWAECKGLRFGEIKDKSHAHPAYSKTWDNRKTENDLMNFEDFIDPKNTATLDHLRENGPNIQL
jgi:uncharacterized phage-associated protein